MWRKEKLWGTIKEEKVFKEEEHEEVEKYIWKNLNDGFYIKLHELKETTDLFGTYRGYGFGTKMTMI